MINVRKTVEANLSEIVISISVGAFTYFMMTTRKYFAHEMRNR